MGGNVPSQAFNNAIDRAQPQAGALSHGLGGEKRYERLLDFVRLEPAAVVRHRDGYVIPALCDLKADFSLRPVLECIYGIVEQVQKNLL